MSMFEETESYQIIRDYLTVKLNQRLIEAQDNFINRLRQVLNPEQVDLLEQLDLSTDYQIVIRDHIDPKKIDVHHKDRCLALVSGYRRCDRKKVNESLCNRHLKMSPETLKKQKRGLITDFEEHAEKINENFNYISLQARKGRRNYQISDNLETDYVQVCLVYINDQAYLQDHQGLIYSLDDQVTILGQQRKDLIFWNY